MGHLKPLILVIDRMASVEWPDARMILIQEKKTNCECIHRKRIHLLKQFSHLVSYNDVCRAAKHFTLDYISALGNNMQ